MKILWLSHLLPYPPKAGVLIRSHYMVKELAKYHDVDVLAFNQRALIEPYFDNYENGTKIAIRELSKFCHIVEAIDCPTDNSTLTKLWCAFKSLFTTTSYTTNWLKSPLYQKRVKELHAQRQYDLIHCDTITLAPYINDIVNTPVLSLDHHNVESHMLERRSELEDSTLKKIYFALEAKKVKKEEVTYCPKFDINITCSQLDSDRFKTFIPNAKYLCVPNGVDIEVFKPSDRDPDKNNMIFIGTLDWYPNTRAVEFIAEKIWPLLKIKIPDISINIVGANPPQNLINLSKNDTNFKVHGYVDDLNDLLSKATLYLCPIDDGGGTKLKILDALSAGKAIVANPVACEGIDCEDGKSALYAVEPHEYVEQILRVFQEDDLRLNLEKNARQLAVEKYSYESIGQNLSNSFIEIKNTK